MGKEKAEKPAQKKLNPRALPKEHWKSLPEEHDYPAAADYLALILPSHDVPGAVAALRRSPLVHKKAKDLLRASRLTLLPADNVHVAADLKKVAENEMLSPVLCLTGTLSSDIPLVVADGYHRICASYHITENADIPCQLAQLPPSTPRLVDGGENASITAISSVHP
jgi:hypothetical protein